MYSFKRIPLNADKSKRILVTSDIHGNLFCLRSVLEKAGFCKNDHLIIIGDMLEKGPDSLGTLRYAMKLCEEGNATVLIGNVDYFRLLNVYYTIEHPESAANLFKYIEWIRDWKGTCFYDELLAEVGFRIESADQVVSGMKMIVDSFPKELDFLKNLPTVVESERYIFVHGGLPDHENRSNAASDSETNAASYLKLDMFLTHATENKLRYDRTVVCGHWPVANYGEGLLSDEPIFDDATNILSIDGGCGVQRDGQLNLLVSPSVDCDPSEITNISFDGLPSVKALERQVGSDSASKIVWNDNDVTEIDRCDDLILVEQNTTKNRFWATEDMLWSTDSGGLKASKCTDYQLDVFVGDELSLVKTTSKGIIAKKNGIIGWYYGKYE